MAAIFVSTRPRGRACSRTVLSVMSLVWAPAPKGGQALRQVGRGGEERHDQVRQLVVGYQDHSGRRIIEHPPDRRVIQSEPLPRSQTELARLRGGGVTHVGHNVDDRQPADIRAG
jgi:hypothetical protein